MSDEIVKDEEFSINKIRIILKKDFGTIKKIVKVLNLKPDNKNLYTLQDFEQIKKFINEHSDLRKTLYEITCVEKYGVTNVFLRKDVKEKCVKNSHTKECIEKQIESRNKSFENYEGGYIQYMSDICKERNKDESYKRMVAERTKEAIFEKYGVENISQLEEIKEKKRQSTMKTLGVSNPLKSKEVRENGMLKKYGVDNPAKHKEFLNKRIQTRLDRTEEENLESYNKRVETLKNKYGENYQEIISNKALETNKKNHGGVLYQQTEGYRERMRMECFAKTGYYHHSQNPKYRSNHHTCYELDNFQFDSSWELAYYIYLRDNNIPFEFHTITIPYEWNNEIHQYKPDFKVYDRIVEIKGDHLLKKNFFNDDGRSQAKYKCMIENDVLILTEKDIKPYIKYVKEKYGKDFMKKCRINYININNGETNE